MNESQGMKVVGDLYAAYGEEDVEGFYKDLSPDLTWIECEGFPAPGVFHTQEDIFAHVFAVLERDWADWKFELEKLIDGGGTVVAIGAYSGTHRETAKSFRARAAHVWHVVDGKIVRFEQFADTHPMQAAATA
ncbi:nuclear transport factor 2 family protein [Streptomyces sp. NPDC026672]|uniref:nuclear transport factor 2 family protein n=1 Tax=unclassified Streptomyces TaxID=2593676 RepID=UPI0033E3F415